MQEFRIDFRENAQKALNDIFDRYNELVGIDSAVSAVGKIKKAIEHLAYVPYIGKTCGQRELDVLGIRQLNCGNYICFYRLKENVVEVVDIVDGRTDYIKRLLENR